jgi:4,5-DOPA dioxygenase extradiol
MIKKMPAMFIGHGSPLNAIDENEYVQQWIEIGKKLEKPDAILSISAHWVTRGTCINDEDNPKMIYDMYGFPAELYNVEYPAPGSKKMAHNTMTLIDENVTINNEWGIDHGTWSVLCRMFPDADIPVYQLSLNQSASAEEHYKIGQEISGLREKGVLIMGSGNIVHNLYKVNFNMQSGYPWADDFDKYIQDAIISRDYASIINFNLAGESAKQAFYTTEHYFPLLYVLGASHEDDQLSIYNDSRTLGSVSMTCYLFE